MKSFSSFHQKLYAFFFTTIHVFLLHVDGDMVTKNDYIGQNFKTNQKQLSPSCKPVSFCRLTKIINFTALMIIQLLSLS